MSAGEASADPATWWEARYAARERPWSGNPNALLVEAADGLTPGTALDLGCGTGGDAVWLAAQGWRVTATDIAPSALADAAAAAEVAGVADRIAWERHDLGASFPDGEFDLVSACFLHSPVALPREAVLRRAAEAVAPGGSLVVVGHAGPPTWAPRDREHGHGVHLPTPEEVLDDVGVREAGWEVLDASVRAMPSTSPDGVAGTRSDNVLHVRRRAAG